MARTYCSLFALFGVTLSRARAGGDRVEYSTDPNRNNGGIFQTVAATPGQQFTLSFDYAAWATNAVGARVRYRLYNPTNGFVFSEDVITAAMGLDNVVLTTTMNVVPEPSSFALLLAGLGSMFLVARRRRSGSSPLAQRNGDGHSEQGDPPAI